jgi:hypothetical protein
LGRGGDSRGLAWLGGLGLLLLVVMVWPYAVDGYRFGVGPDVPVYLWWTRVTAVEGLSAIGSRPGAPALAAALAGTMNLNAAAVTAALASALGVAVGTAAGALVRAAGRHDGAWWLAGVLAGVFSVHLVAGYLANLILAVCFLAAAACLAGGRRAWWGAAILLAGGGLAHLPFLGQAVVVLIGSAALAWRAGARDEARDTALASAAGGLVAGAGVLMTLAGPGPIDAPTSKDAYLRRAGLDAPLVEAYRERLRLRAARYVQWIAVPLAILGTSDAGGFLRRFLASWLVVMAAAIPVGWITGWFPPDRIVTFGFAVPIAAALGSVWLRRRLGRRPWLATALVAVLAGWMILGALLAWGRQEPFINSEEMRAVAEAADIAQLTEPGVPIVFPVDDGDPTSTFLAARAANIARAAVPPGKADDVYVFVGSVTDFFEDRPTSRGDDEFDALSRSTLADVPEGPDRVVILLGPFYRLPDGATDPRLIRWATGVRTNAESGFTPLPMEPDGEPLAFGPSSGGAISSTTLGILALLAVLGFGYARSVFDDTATALATAPAFGTASVTLVAVALDTVGLRLEGSGVAIAASALAGLGGVALLLATQRTRARQPAA